MTAVTHLQLLTLLTGQLALLQPGHQSPASLAALARAAPGHP